MTRALLAAAIIIASLSSICRADLAMGPTLGPGQTLHGCFVQTQHLTGLASTLQSEGSFVLAPGKGLIWRTQDPIQTITVISPAGIDQIVNNASVQHIDTAKAPFIAHFYDMLNGALMGDWAGMRQDFAVTTTGDRRAWRTILKPLRPKDPIEGIIASIVIIGGKMVDEADINRTNGDAERIAFHDQAISNAALSSDDARLLKSTEIDPAN
jgi:hypothetical protein